MSGPNEGTFLLPGPQGKGFQDSIVDVRLITFLSILQPHPLLQG